MVFSAKEEAKGRIGFPQKLPAEVHGYLPGKGYPSILSVFSEFRYGTAVAGSHDGKYGVGIDRLWSARPAHQGRKFPDIGKNSVLFVTETHLLEHSPDMAQAQAVAGKEQGVFPAFGKSALLHGRLREPEAHIKVGFGQPQRKLCAKPVVQQREQFLPSFVLIVGLVGGKKNGSWKII